MNERTEVVTTGPGCHVPIEQTEVFQLCRQVANSARRLATEWPEFAKRTIATQLVRSADSICANLVEGDGRFTTADAIRFFVIARGSARETRYWISVAADRHLIERSAAGELSNLICSATRQLNGLIRYRQQTKHEPMVREHIAPYAIEDDPFEDDPT